MNMVFCAMDQACKPAGFTAMENIVLSQPGKYKQPNEVLKMSLPVVPVRSPGSERAAGRL